MFKISSTLLTRCEEDRTLTTEVSELGIRFRAIVDRLLVVVPTRGEHEFKLTKVVRDADGGISKWVYAGVGAYRDWTLHIYND
jgi:hypothetical protein